MARIAVGGIWHETNTFVVGTTTAADFSAYQYGAGAELVGRFTGVRNEVGGFLAGLHAIGATPVPTLFAAAVPSGLVARAAYETLKQEMLSRLADAGPVDGVLLALHGAMVVDGLDDPEADLCGAVRQLISDVPIVATMDFHANVSNDLFEAADLLLGYDTYPHVDPYDRGVEAARLLMGICEAGTPAKAFQKLPLLTAPTAQETAVEPMASISRRRMAWEERDGVVAVTVSPGFPYADVARLGFSVAAYATDDVLAKEAAADIAEQAWSRRLDFAPPAVAPADAVRRAAAAPRGPVVLVDVADNVGGGSPGDGTVLLNELLGQQVPGAVVVIADPAAAADAARAGAGATVTLDVGGKTDGRHGPPVTVTARVERVTDGRFVHKGSYMTGQVTEMGTTAVVAVPVVGGVVEIVLTSRRTMPFDAEQLRSLGVEPTERKVIVVKAAIAWRAAYGEMAAESVLVSTPGACSSDLASLPYTKLPRPIAPLDAGAFRASRAWS